MSVNKTAPLLVIGLLMSACQAEPVVPTPIPTAEIVVVQVSPALRPWQQRLHDCAQANPAMGLEVYEIPSSAMDLSAAQVSLTMDANRIREGYASDLGRQAIRIVANPDLPQLTLDPDQLRGIYTGSLANWSDAGGPDLAIQAWTYPAGDDLRQAFEALLGGLGAGAPLAGLAPDPQALLQAIQDTPGSIGYLPADWDSGAVQTLTLDASAAGLDAPILALTAGEPQGMTRGLIACLQASAPGQP